MDRGVFPYEPWHYTAMVNRIHEGNHREAWALYHISAEEGLYQSIEASQEVWTGILDDLPIAIYGLSRDGSLLSDRANPWLICSEDIDMAPVSFLKGFKRSLPYMLGQYRILENYVDARNTQVLRIVEWAGFTVYPPKPMGLDLLPFHRIVLERGDSLCV